MSDVAERVKKIVVEHLGVDADKVVDGANFMEDLGADSLDTVELVMAFEEEFGVEIPDDAAETIVTVGDAIKFLEKPPRLISPECRCAADFANRSDSVMQFDFGAEVSPRSMEQGTIGSVRLTARPQMARIGSRIFRRFRRLRPASGSLEHVPEKLIDFSVFRHRIYPMSHFLELGYIRVLIDENMLQLIDLERFPSIGWNSTRSENALGSRRKGRISARCPGNAEEHLRTPAPRVGCHWPAQFLAGVEAQSHLIGRATQYRDGVLDLFTRNFFMCKNVCAGGSPGRGDRVRIDA